MRLTLCQVNVARVLNNALASTAELLINRGTAEGFLHFHFRENLGACHVPMA
jgi:hypothetical protein